MSRVSECARGVKLCSLAPVNSRIPQWKWAPPLNSSVLKMGLWVRRWSYRQWWAQDRAEMGIGGRHGVGDDSDIRGGDGFEDCVPPCRKWEMQESYGSLGD